MMIYPAIEIQSGRCVSLHRGRIEEPQIWHVDPVKTARKFAADGASWLHLTDLDAVEGHPDMNRDLMRDIIRHAEIPVQFGGGLSSMDAIAHWVDAGVGRAIIGSAAVTNPDLVKKAAHAWPDQIAVAVDVWQGKVTKGGWRTKTVFDPVDFVENFASDPLAALIVTDIDSHIDQTDASLSLVTRVARAAKAPVIARGTIWELDDIARLKYVSGIDGTIIGKAFFDRSMAFADALAVAAAQKEAVAPFV